VKAGRTKAGSRRYKCQHCQRRYTPEPKEAGYGEALRQQAVRLYVDGMNFRRIARHLGVNHQSVINWINAYVAHLPEQAPQPETVTVIEQDELFTFIGAKKKQAYILTLVERATSCIVGWMVTCTCDSQHWQGVLDDAPQAVLYYSDDSATYDGLIYTPGIHLALPDKSQTYRVEGDNAELRHYLARLARRSRCFSRSLQALWRAVKLFVYAWNRRQLYKQRHPNYPAHLMNFV
jgi:IS1 family transposase